jgi:hypothetical protein
LTTGGADHALAPTNPHDGRPRRWRQRFDEPINLPDGRQRLRTLKDAQTYILKLKETDQPPWQTAKQALILSAEGRGSIKDARIGVMQALIRRP